MLHRRFKTAKCKTALKLSSSRIKLLKNKKEAIVQKLEGELAQLLESGQDQTARVLVEHLVREEKTATAYDLIHIYCEQILARLSVIESQKSCPSDLKESISSVIFASSRCEDISELKDIRKHLSVKYGKDFVSSALQLRPECCVSRQLVEKLSIKPPDGPAKMKILTAISEKYGVKWDSGLSFEDPATPSRYLKTGPEDSYEIHAGSGYRVGQADSHYNNAPSGQLRNDRASLDSSSDSQSHHEMHSSPEKGIGSQEHRRSHSNDSTGVPMGKKNWKMEFKDATAAAQAAADSAEQASFAARAAVELSSRGRMAGQLSADHGGTSSRPAYIMQGSLSKSGSFGTLDKEDGEEHSDVTALDERFHNLKNTFGPPKRSSVTSIDRESSVEFNINRVNRGEYNDEHYRTSMVTPDSYDSAAMHAPVVNTRPTFDTSSSEDDECRSSSNRRSASKLSPQSAPIFQDPTSNDTIFECDLPPVSFDDSDGSTSEDVENGTSLHEADDTAFQKHGYGGRKGLKLGVLKGGLRNKLNQNPPYFDQPSASHSPRSHRLEPKFEDDDGEILSKNFESKAVIRSAKKWGQKTYFDSDNSEDEGRPSVDAPRKGSGLGISRRTRTRSDPTVASKTTDPESDKESSLLAGNFTQFEDGGSNKSKLDHKVVMSRGMERTSVKPVLGSIKTAVSDSAEMSRVALDGVSPSDSYSARAGHVHPKLPDYDTFAAHFLSFDKKR